MPASLVFSLQAPVWRKRPPPDRTSLVTYPLLRVPGGLREQLLDRKVAADQSLIARVLHEALEVRAVGLEPGRPDVLAEHVVLTLEVAAPERKARPVRIGVIVLR